MRSDIRVWLGAVVVGAMTSIVLAQTPVQNPTQTPPARGAGAGPGRAGGGSFGTDENAVLIFEEHWTNAPLTQPMTQANLIAMPDLSKIDEIGFSDLMPGGFIPATTRVNSWAVYGKKVPR